MQHKCHFFRKPQNGGKRTFTTNCSLPQLLVLIAKVFGLCPKAYYNRNKATHTMDMSFLERTKKLRSTRRNQKHALAFDHLFTLSKKCKPIHNTPLVIWCSGDHNKSALFYNLRREFANTKPSKAAAAMETNNNDINNDDSNQNNMSNWSNKSKNMRQEWQPRRSGIIDIIK